MLKISIGDILDRYSIVKLKSERTAIDCSAELTALSKEIEDYTDIDEFVEKLYIVNGKIWDLEADIRQEKEALLGLEEVGRRAIKIRQFNGERVFIKNQVNSKFNEGFTETKVNHGSQSKLEELTKN